MITSIVKKLRKWIVTGGVVLSAAAALSAQSMNVNGGNVALTLSTGTAGGEMQAMVSTSTTLAYRKQSTLSKITVRTVCSGQSFSLSALATNVTSGSAAAAVVLLNGNPAVDLVRSIPTTGSTNQSCRIQFTASAAFAQGNSSELGNDTHTITYTIQSQ